MVRRPRAAGGAGAGARRKRRRRDCRQRVRIRSARTLLARLARWNRLGAPVRDLQSRQQHEAPRAWREGAGSVPSSPRGGSGTAEQRSRQLPGWRRPARGAKAPWGPEQHGVGSHFQGKAQANRLRGPARAGPRCADSWRGSKRAHHAAIPPTASAASVTRVAPPDSRSEVRLRLPRGQRQKRRQQRERAWRARKADGDEWPCVVRHQRLRWVGKLIGCNELCADLAGAET